jgi:nucleoside-diphosphate-sugar epimerase
MRVLIAGATGFIGRPLIRCLKQDRHTVFALARSQGSSHVMTQLGAEPVTADALDAASVKAVLDSTRPDAIINELTSLPRHYPAAEMRAAAERNRKVCIEGNANLLAALQDTGERRYFCRAPHSGTRRVTASPRKRVLRIRCVGSGRRRRAPLRPTRSRGIGHTRHCICRFALRLLLWPRHLVSQ